MSFVYIEFHIQFHSKIYLKYFSWFIPAALHKQTERHQDNVTPGKSEQEAGL